MIAASADEQSPAGYYCGFPVPGPKLLDPPPMCFKPYRPFLASGEPAFACARHSANRAANIELFGLPPEWKSFDTWHAA